MYGQTDGRTDRQTDGRTEAQMTTTMMMYITCSLTLHLSALYVLLLGLCSANRCKPTTVDLLLMHACVRECVLLGAVWLCHYPATHEST